MQPALGESQLVLSFLHSEGHGVEKDEGKSLALLRESAHTCEMAMHILGNMHLSGQNVEQDYEQAFRYFKQASDLDFGKLSNPAHDELLLIFFVPFDDVLTSAVKFLLKHFAVKCSLKEWVVKRLKKTGKWALGCCLWQPTRMNRMLC